MAFSDNHPLRSNLFVSCDLSLNGFLRQDDSPEALGCMKYFDGGGDDAEGGDDGNGWVRTRM